MSLMVAFSLSVFKHLKIQRSTFYYHIKLAVAANKRNFNLWPRYTKVLHFIWFSQRSTRKKKFQRIARYNVLLFIDTRRFFFLYCSLNAQQQKRNFNVLPDTRTFFFLFSQRSTTRIMHASQEIIQKKKYYVHMPPKAMSCG